MEEEYQEKDGAYRKELENKGIKESRTTQDTLLFSFTCCLPFLSLPFPPLILSKTFKQTERQSHETQTAKTTSKEYSGKGTFCEKCEKITTTTQQTTNREIDKPCKAGGGGD